MDAGCAIGGVATWVPYYAPHTGARAALGRTPLEVIGATPVGWWRSALLCAVSIEAGRSRLGFAPPGQFGHFRPVRSYCPWYLVQLGPISVCLFELLVKPIPRSFAIDICQVTAWHGRHRLVATVSRSPNRHNALESNRCRSLGRVGVAP